MTDYSNFKAQIAEWANRQDWSDALVTSFIRMAEQKLNESLRIGLMVKSSAANILDRCATLPCDWLASELVTFQSQNAPSGWAPIRYKANDEFFNLTDKNAYGYYTVVGRTMTFGGTPDALYGLQYTIAYYAELPVFADDCDSWVYTKYPSLYLAAAMIHANLHAVGEEDKAAALATQVDATVNRLNNAWLVAKASGSRVTRTRTRSFG